MSAPDQSPDQEIAPWAEEVSYYNNQLEITLEVPGDWQAGATPDCPLQLTAPPRGVPPYQVAIRIFINTAPSAPEMLPFVADEIFNSAHTPNMIDYSGMDVLRLELGSLPAFLHRSSWALRLPDGRQFDMRQQILAVAVQDRFYIYSLVVPPYMVDAASQVFINMIRTARYGPIDGEDEEPTAVVSESSGESRASSAASSASSGSSSASARGRVQENGRWVSQRILTRE